MEFDEVLARTINLLERQGFATYRTLKRRFHLDDATLAAQRLNGHVEQILQKTAYSREDLLREVRDLVAQGVR